MSPLLGLLGTVTGIISAFNTINSQGVGDPRALAGGIGEARRGEVEEEALGGEAAQSNRARRVDQPARGSGLEAVARGAGWWRGDGGHGRE